MDYLDLLKTLAWIAVVGLAIWLPARRGASRPPNKAHISGVLVGGADGGACVAGDGGGGC